MPWENVPCHPTVRKIVMRAISRGHFGRTSLVYGPAGAGQAQVARAIAQTYICETNVNQVNSSDFCGKCTFCNRIQQGIYPDVIEMHPWEDWSKEKEKGKEKEKKRKKNEYKVDHMRVMQEQALHLPYEGDLKFYIIHDAHCMNDSSSNSLLKILEEPHPHIRFILLTDQVSAILPTIRSRCWSIRLIPLDIQILAQSLQSELPPERALAIARAAGGLPDQAQSLMESGYLERRDWLFDLMMQVKQRESAVIELAEEITKSKQNLSEILPILLRIVRDGIVVAAGGDGTQFENLDRGDDLQKLWRTANIEGLVDGMKCILDASEDLDRFVNPSVLMMDLLLHLRLAMVS